MSVQHRYAQLTSTGVAVDIRKTSKSDGPFKCLDPKCGLEMIAHKGEVNTHYFAHKAGECKLRAESNGGGGGGESSSHIYFKRFVSGQIRSMVFQRLCVGCKRPTRTHRFPPAMRVVLEHPVTLGENKYVLDVALLDPSKPTVIGVIEVRHRHAVPQQKAVDLLAHYGLSVHELATDELEAYESAVVREPLRDLLGDAREHCSVCKGGDEMDQDPRLLEGNACFKWNSRLFMHRAASAMRPDRKCSTCGSWIHHSAATAIAVPKYEYKPGKFSFTRFACAHCQKKCPCCRQTVLDAAYIADNKQCARCEAEVKRISKQVKNPLSDKQALEACRTSRVLTLSEIHLTLKEELATAIRNREEEEQKKAKHSITACFKKQLEKRKYIMMGLPMPSEAPPPLELPPPQQQPPTKKLKPNSLISDFFKPRAK